jgi:hypothetical protein
MGTEAGEVYMIAFHLETLRELSKGGSLAHTSFDNPKYQAMMCVEFLGARLSCCSSI